MMVRNAILWTLAATLLLVAGVAFAQDGGPEPPTSSPVWGYVILAIPAVASLVSAIFPSTNVVMRAIDFLAFNWLRARNDPNAQ